MGEVVAAFGRSYPADPRSGAGIEFDKFGLSYRVRLDYRNIQYSLVAPTTGLIVAQNPIDGSLICFDIAGLPISPQFISALLTGPVPEGYPPRRSQFLAALEASSPGRVADVRAAVPLDPSDPINRAWEHTLFVSTDGILAQFVRATLSLSNDDLTTILREARTISD